MPLELPFEQLVRRRGHRDQLDFATEAMQRVPAGAEFMLKPSPLGVRLLARDEGALQPPLRALREKYGADLQIAPPRVRFIDGARTQEPIMQVEVTVDPGHAARVRRALSRRGAKPLAESIGRISLMRYAAPLANLVGLKEELDRIAKGAARHWMALSHYAHVKRRRHDLP
jgi:predicted membrane GTPase involved in stress response